MRPDTGKTWTCLICGETIRRRDNPRPGSPFYEHVDAVILSSHDAVRAPRVQSCLRKPRDTPVNLPTHPRHRTP